MPVVAKCLPYNMGPAFKRTSSCCTQLKKQQSALVMEGKHFVGPLQSIVPLMDCQGQFDDHDFPFHNNFKTTLFPPPYSLAPSLPLT